MKATLTRKTDLEILIESRDKNAINALIEQKEIAPSRPEVGAISLRIILFLISLSYSTPDAPEPAPKAALTSHPALSPASCLPGSDQLR